MKKILLFLLFANPVYLLTAQITSPGFDPVFAGRLQATLQNAFASSGAHGVSVAYYVPGQGTFIGVAGESSPGIPITPDMQFAIGSNTKLFTAVLALKLQELGIISLDDALNEWIGAYQYVDGSATIRQCLLHHTGTFDFSNDIDWTDYALVYGPDGPDFFYTPQATLARIGPPNFPVGTGYRYSNTGYVLTALAMEAATGKTYTELLHQYIFDPLDLDSTFLATYEVPNGNVVGGWYFGNYIGTAPLISPFSMYWASGSIYSTANEMVQWYDHLFAGDIINQASLDQLTKFEHSSWSGLGIEMDFLVPEYINWEHGGGVPGGSSQMIFDPKQKTSFAILCNDFDDGATVVNIFVPLLNDIYFNYPRKQHDAGISAIIAPTSQLCQATVTPNVQLKNYGNNNLTSVLINYQVDGGAINTYNWTGNLLKDQTVNVAIPAISIAAGNHSFRSYTSQPNGFAEGYIYNDESISFFNINDLPVTPFFEEGFEGPFPPTGWVCGANTLFDWGKTNLSSFSGNSCAVKNDWNDRSLRTYDLELPLLNLNSLTDPVLSFDYAYALYGAQYGGRLEVLVSKDCGSTYQKVFNKSGHSLKTANDTELFYPNPDEWGERTINLTNFKNDQILIKFRATSANGNNFYLDNVRVADIMEICPRPTDLNELQITSTSVKLSWKFHGNASQFDVYYRPRSTTVWNHKTIAGNKQWVNISNLVADTDYEWYISAACISGYSLASPYSFFTTETPSLQSNELTLQETEIGSKAILPELKVWPNPTSSTTQISFDLSKTDKVCVDLYDISGKMIQTIVNRNFSEGPHRLALDTRNLKAGVYIIRMQTTDSMQIKKVIVLK